MDLILPLTVEQLREAVVEYAAARAGELLMAQIQFGPEDITFEQDYDGVIQGVTIKAKRR